MKILTYSLILIITVCSHSYADPSSDNTSSIEEMFKLMGVDKQMNGWFEAMLPMVNQMATQLQLNTDQVEQLKNIYRDWF